MIPIGIKNLTANTLYVKELQVEVSGNQTFFLGTYDFFDLAAAQSLKDLINAGSAVIIRDDVQLSQADSLAYVTTPSSGGGGSGEVNTASNVGTGAGQVFKQKTGVDLELKTIKAGTNITVTNNADDITIDASGGGSGGISLTDLSVTAEGAPGGNGDLAYNSASGEFTYSPPLLDGLTAAGTTDFGANKIQYANNYATLADLPSASTYHGMFAHVHAQGAAYYSHAGNWVKLADASSAGGKSRYPVITKARLHEFNDYNVIGGNYDGRISNGFCSEIPISFGGDVVLTKVECRQTNTNSGAAANGGRLGIYKLHSIVASGGQAGNFRFDKVYQETQTFDFSSALAGTDQEITLTTPQTLEAGELYIIAIVDDYAVNDATTPTLFGRRGLNARIPFSSAMSNQRENSASLFWTNATSGYTSPLSITGGVMVNSAVLRTNGFSYSYSVSKCLLTIQNA